MNNIIKSLLAAALLVTFSACYRNSMNEGPSERAGRHIDDTGEAIADSAHDVKENAKSAAKDVKRNFDRKEGM